MDKELNVLKFKKNLGVEEMIVIFYENQFVVMYYGAFSNLIRLDMPEWARGERRPGDTSPDNISQTVILGTKTTCHFEEGLAERGSDLGAWYYNDVEIVGSNFANQRIVMRLPIVKYKKLRKIVLP